MNRFFPKYFQDIMLFTVLIWVKAILFRALILPPLFAKGILADLVMVLVVVSFITLVSSYKVRRYMLFAVSSLLSLIWFSSATYFSYYGNIPTYLALTNLGQVGQIGDSIKASIVPSFYLFFLDIILILAYFIVIKIRHVKQVGVSSATTLHVIPARSRVLLFSGIVLVFSLVMSTMLIKQAKTITNELELARHLGMYHYQIAFATDPDRKLLEQGALSEAERQQLIDSIKHIIDEEEMGERAYTGVSQGQHLISIQLEAFQNLLIGLEVNGQEITPFLNELIKTSFYFPHFYQQIGEGNTSDAEFIANTGAYPQANQAMSKLVGNKIVLGLPRILKEEGYHSYTFHVNDVTFWNRNELYPALGFDQYYEKADFVNDNFNSFGASDRELYRVVIEELVKKDELGEKIYSHIITTSGHHPFIIPVELRSLELPASLEGTQLGHYLHAGRYVDNELRTFFANLEANNLREKSTIVLYGDHFGLQTKDNNPAWVKEQIGIEYVDKLVAFNLPLIISIPNVVGETIEMTSGQVDIVPTVLNLFGINHRDTELVLFGQDLLNTTTNTLGIRYYMPTGSFFNDDIMYEPGESFETGTAIDLDTYQFIDDITHLKSDYDYVLKLMKESDLYTSNYREMEKVVTETITEQ